MNERRIALFIMILKTGIRIQKEDLVLTTNLIEIQGSNHRVEMICRGCGSELDLTRIRIPPLKKKTDSDPTCRKNGIRIRPSKNNPDPGPTVISTYIHQNVILCFHFTTYTNIGSLFLFSFHSLYLNLPL